MVMIIHKKIIYDEYQRPIAIQIPIEEFEQIEEVLENFSLAKMIDDATQEEKLPLEEARIYYQQLKLNVND